MNELSKARRSVDRNAVALILSVIPGAGHLYKHHYTAGFSILMGGNMLMVFVAVMLALGTFGLSLMLVPLVYVLAIGASAYALPDWHGHHHFLHPWSHEDK